MFYDRLLAVVIYLKINYMQKFKIQSNKEELEDIGISYDINGLIGTLVKSYPTGWLVLSVTHKVGEYEFTNEFDLPKYMCKAVL